jgi:ABC-2 type transport system permease protein
VVDRGRTWAIALRIVRQFRRDRRTLALIIIVPALVLSLVGYLLRSTENSISLVAVDRMSAPGPVLDLLERALGQAGWDLRVVSTEEEALAAVKAGDVDGAVILRAADSDGTTVPKVELVLEGSNPQKSQAVRRLVSQVVMLAGLSSLTQPPESPPVGEGAAGQVETRYVHGGPQFDTVDFQAPPLIGFFAFFFVFLLTAVSFLRERTGGTLERLMVTPARRAEVVLGYMLGFGVLAVVQAVIILLVALLVLDINYVGNLGLVFLLVITLTVAAVNLGIFLSTFARNELQAIQFIPLVIVPQGLLSGVVWSIDSMPRWLQGVAQAMPLTYSNQALRGVMLEAQGLGSGELLRNFGILLAFAAFFVLLSSLTLRQRMD